MVTVSAAELIEAVEFIFFSTHVTLNLKKLTSNLSIGGFYLPSRKKPAELEKMGRQMFPVLY